VKSWRIAAVLLLCLVSVGLISCATIGGNSAEDTQQLVKVVSGNLTFTVSGSGSIEASRKLSLSFGGNGRIEKIYVEEGDEVITGKVLTKLDTSALDLSYTQAKISLIQSEIALKQAEIAQQTAEYNLKNIRDSEGALKLALLNAQISLEQAQRNLSTGIAAVDYQAIEAELRKAKTWYDYVEDSLQEATSDKVDDWLLALDRAQERLDIAQTNYDNALAGYSSQEVTIKKQQVESAKMALAQAQKDLDDYDLAEDIAAQELQVESARLSVEKAEQNLELARQSLQEAQRQLDEAGIIAPFDGVVTSVGAEEGDTVTSAAPIIYLMDPASKELVVEVDETDVTEVKLGQRAIIEADALPGIILKGKVTYVSPVARNSAGLMLYKVKIDLDVPDDSHLKVGMSASADIVIEERANVLLVPNRAIKRDSQGNQIVHVMVGEQIQERQVVTGISDGLQTEIISGLNEGEIVVR
jgi:HlyD family secretion protein